MGNGRDISKDKLGRSLPGDAVASGLVAASLFGAGTASAWCASAGGIINLGKKESTILKSSLLELSPLECWRCRLRGSPEPIQTPIPIPALPGISASPQVRE